MLLLLHRQLLCLYATTIGFTAMRVVARGAARVPVKGATGLIRTITAAATTQHFAVRRVSTDLRVEIGQGLVTVDVVARSGRTRVAADLVGGLWG